MHPPSQPPFPLMEKRRAKQKQQQKSKHEIKNTQRCHEESEVVMANTCMSSVIRHLHHLYRELDSALVRPGRKTQNPERSHVVGQRRLRQKMFPRNLVESMANRAMHGGPGFESWLTSPQEEKRRGKNARGKTLTHMPNRSKAACRYDVMQPETHPGPIRRERKKSKPTRCKS